MVTGDSRERHPRCTDPKGRRGAGGGGGPEGARVAARGGVSTPAKGEENRQAWKMWSHVTSCGTVRDPMGNEIKKTRWH